MFAFQDLLQISLDIFLELDLDNLTSKKNILAQEKIVYKKKKISGLLRSGMEEIEKEKKEEILGIHISKGDQIICNTRKMLLQNPILAQHNYWNQRFNLKVDSLDVF